jgi:hypothetical protein
MSSIGARNKGNSTKDILSIFKPIIIIDAGINLNLSLNKFKRTNANTYQNSNKL